jgi:hypothetical protein
MTGPVFSRPGRTNAYGKNTEEIKTSVPEQIKDEVAAVAIPQGKTPSEYLRELVIADLHGRVPEELRSIVWAHACRETECPYLRALLHQAIFGGVHELSLAAEEFQNRAEIRLTSGVTG